VSSDYLEVNYEEKPTYTEWLKQELELQTTDDFSHPSLLNCLEELEVHMPKEKKRKQKEKRKLIV